MSKEETETPEIRRSSRSNKGKNSRLERDLDLLAPAPKRTRKAKGSSSKQEEAAGGDHQEDDGTINCICGYNVDDGKKGSMIECENCFKWQHIVCMFGKDDESLVPDVYICHECSAKQSQPHPKAEATVEAKVEGKVEAKAEANADTDADLEADKKAAARADAKADDANDVKADAAKSVVPSATPSQPSISQLTNKVRASVATALHRILANTAYPEARRKKVDIAKDKPDQTDQTDTERAEQLALAIERALYEQLAVKPTSKSKANYDVGPKYRDKFRSISFNLKDGKNYTLRMRVVSGELDPPQLVKMTNEDMSNPELQKLAADVRKESIRDSVLKVDDAPRLRKTHKGEELVDAQEQYEDVIGEPDEVQSHGPATSNDDGQYSTDMTNDNNDSDHHKSNDEDTTKTDDHPGDMFDQPPNFDDAYSPPGSPVVAAIIDDDDDLDQIINGDDGDDSGAQSAAANSASGNGTGRGQPSDNAAQPAAPVSIWTGHVSFKGFVEFAGTLTSVHSPPGFVWDSVLSPTTPIVIDGRLDQKKATEYLETVRTKKHIASLLLQSDGDRGSGADQVFEYFHPRAKYGVITKHAHARTIVKDAYAVSLGPHDPIPTYLGLSTSETRMIAARQSQNHKLVLVVFVVNADITTPPPPTAIAAAAAGQGMGVPVVSNGAAGTTGRTPPGSGVSGGSLGGGSHGTSGSAAGGQGDLLQQLGLSTADIGVLQTVLQTHPEAAQDPQLLLALLANSSARQ